MKKAAVPPQIEVLFFLIRTTKIYTEVTYNILIENVSSPETQKFHVDFQKDYSFPCSIYHVRLWIYLENFFLQYSVAYISILCRHRGHATLKLQLSVTDAVIFQRQLQMKLLNRLEGKA